MFAEAPGSRLSSFVPPADTGLAKGGGDSMACRGIDPTLRRSVERGEYVVDSRAVAVAILRSRVLVAAQTGNGALRPKKNQSATG
jgi:hypothetical protein